MEIKQELHDVFLEELKVKEHFLPNETNKEETSFNEMYNQANAIKNNLLSIKQEYDPTSCTDHLQETYIKSEIKTESVINLMSGNETQCNSIQLKCRNPSKKGNLWRRNYSKYWSLDRGIVSCGLCGSMYTRRFEIILHIAEHFTKNNKCIFQSSNQEEVKQKNVNYGLQSDFGKEIKNMSSAKTQTYSRQVNNIGFKSFRTHSGQKSFKCNICLKSFSQQGSLKTHMLVHTDDKPFKCYICLKAFNQRSSLKTHMHVHTGDKPFKCDICLKSFSQRGNLKTHKLVHTDDKPFKCQKCLKTFKQKIFLISHMVVHRDDKPFQCNICLISLRRQGDLKRHMLAHAGDKPFKCDICLKSFNRRNTLNRHMLIHTGDTAFKCEICLKSFSRREHLKQHMLVHADDKPFKCQICFKSYTAKHNLILHMTVHTGIKQFQCEICLKYFNQQSNLKQHKLVHADDKPFKCQNCLKSFKQKNSLVSHMKQHMDKDQFKCEICLKSFIRRDHLKRHMLVHTGDDKPLKNQICSKSYTQKNNVCHSTFLQTVSASSSSPNAEYTLSPQSLQITQADGLSRRSVRIKNPPTYLDDFMMEGDWLLENNHLNVNFVQNSLDKKIV